MMKYYIGLKDSIENHIRVSYELELDVNEKSKARINFKYKRTGTDEWINGDKFGKLERDVIAESPEFKLYENSIKMYFPYRLFNKIVADLMMEETYKKVIAVA